MLLRIIVDNLFSFGSQTEFNMFTNKSQRHLQHKKYINDIAYLKMAALYGANGAGKSNLIKSLYLLVECMRKGKLMAFADELKFKLDSRNIQKPSSIGVEFVVNQKVFFYTISFDSSGVLYEYLSESGRHSEKRIFERYFEEDKENILFYDGYSTDSRHQMFVEMLSEKFVGRNDLLICILQDKYSDDFPETRSAYRWFTKTLTILGADERIQPIAYVFDKEKKMFDYANNLIGKLSTGVVGLSVSSSELIKTDENSFIFDRLKKDPNSISETRNMITGDVVNYVKEGEKVMAKRIRALHINNEGQSVTFGFGLESDGTQRLVDYLPMIYHIIYNDSVIIIDEIERSIHPIIIKELISLLSAKDDMKGQLIFSTHESCLLDQDILRTDEIWFAQKNQKGSTQLYSLSDFNVHSTANIENGYLNGRYGGIPFLTNLKDLHWEYGQK
jgi:AAA15 family ATPase/GTPase